MKRRDFLKTSLAGVGGILGSQMTPLSDFAASSTPRIASQTPAQTDESGALVLKGSVLNVHDPVMIKEGEYYYVFCTGVGVPMKRSKDMLDWKIARGGTIFQKQPEEPFAYVEGATDIWAPDISFYNGKYHLYYAVSTFGSNHSAIGLATNTTLLYGSEGYKWEDHGIVIKSDYPDNYNTIDPNLALDADGEPWLVFGSYWSGIKMIKLDLETGKQSTEDTTLYDLASRKLAPHAIEAPFIIYRNNYYYLFVSFDACCQGIQSTYNVRVGRSEAITGPYVDQEGVPMLEDGGTQVTFPSTQYRGPGHSAIFSENDQDYLVYHAYDAMQGGTPALRIHPITWVEDGWLMVESPET